MNQTRAITSAACGLPAPRHRGWPEADRLNRYKRRVASTDVRYPSTINARGELARNRSRARGLVHFSAERQP